MTPLMVLGLTLAALLGLGAPIIVVLGLPSVVYILLKGFPPELIVQRMFNGMDQFLLLAIPLFMFAGEIMNVGGLTTRLINLSQAYVGRLRASLAQVNLMTNMLMAGISGSAMADASAIGTLLIPKMAEQGYTRAFAAAVTAAGSIVGPIIPPSVVFILYAVLANVSVIDLFLGGVFPGILIILCQMTYVQLVAKKRGFPKGEKQPFNDVMRATVGAIPVMVLPVIVVWGIRGGVFTPIEGAAVAAAYAFALAVAYRKLSMKQLLETGLAVGRTIGEILVIVGVASVLSWILVVEQVPAIISEATLSITKNPILILLIVNVVLLIAGMFMDGFSAMIIFVPIILPIAAGIGMDPVHLGVMVAVNIQVGIITPPVGLCLFITSKIAGVPFAAAVKEILPFIWVSIVALLMITFVPALSLWLPNLFK